MKVFIILGLICSVSFAALASEISSWQLTIKTTAEEDANRDIKKAAWYTAGLGIGIACCLGGCLGYTIAANSYPPIWDNYYPEGSLKSDKECLGLSIPLTLRLLGSLGGASACGGIPFLRIYTNQSNSPSERFIGKSPEYVEYYTAVYTAKARSLRIKLAAAGTVTGCGLAGLISLWFLNNGL